MNRLTGSYLSIVAKCRAAAVLRQLIEPSSKYAEIGNAAHEYYETGVEQHDTFLEVPKFQRPEGRTWATVMHEWRFGWNFVTGEYIAVPKGNGGRDYADYPADQWVMASCDAAWIEGETLYIEDLKTGAPQGPMCEQIVFIARCAQQAFKHEGPVVVQILNATRYGYKTDPKLAGQVTLKSETLTVGELAEKFREMISMYVLEAADLGNPNYHSDAERQDAATPGKHCFFCRSKAYCESYRAKASPKSLMYLDKLREAQEARQDGTDKEAAPRDINNIRGESHVADVARGAGVQTGGESGPNEGGGG